MRHRKKKVTLDRKAGPRNALLKNLAAQVILYEKVSTTVGKAKAIRFSTLEAICKVLECQPGDLLGFEQGEE